MTTDINKSQLNGHKSGIKSQFLMNQFQFFKGMKYSPAPVVKLGSSINGLVDLLKCYYNSYGYRTFHINTCYHIIMEIIRNFKKLPLCCTGKSATLDFA